MLHAPAEYLFIRKVRGRSYRYAYLPNPRSKLQIVFVNGHHSNIERVYPLLEYLHKFGTVYCPDLPGFGKSEPFRTRRPGLEQEADFLHYFCKRHLTEEPVVLIGASMGFMVGTLCLMKHPKMQDQCKGVVNIAGFVTSDSLRFSSRRMGVFRRFTGWMSRRWVARSIQRHLFNQKWLMRRFVEQSLIKKDYRNFSEEQKIIAREFDLQLWQENDLYTHFSTLHDILHLDITGEKIRIPLYAIYTKHDKYIKSEGFARSLKRVYPNSRVIRYGLKGHAPVYVASMKEYTKLIPQDVIGFLRKESKKLKIKGD